VLTGLPLLHENTKSWKLRRLRLYDGNAPEDGLEDNLTLALVNYYINNEKKSVLFIRDLKATQFYLSWKIINFEE
jgi:hypothetical protein